MRHLIRWFLRVPIILLFAVTAQGCAGGDQAPFAVADSAGVRIVTYSTLPANLTVHSYDLVRFSVGETDGEAPYVLSRTAGAVPFGEGGVLIADGASGELRQFDANGRHMRTSGGRGSGPGEFELLRWMGLAGGDSVVAWDLRNRRVTYFNHGLESTTTDLLDPSAPYVVIGVFNDGAFLVWPFGGSGPPLVKGQRVQATAYAAVMSPGSQHADTVVTFPARPGYVVESGDFVRIPFTAEPSDSVLRDQIWVGVGNSGEVKRYSRDGTLNLIVRFPPGAPVLASDVASWLASDPAHAQERRQLPIPESSPSFDEIHAGRDRNLWVRLYSRGDIAEWLVLDESGEAVQRAMTPAAELYWADADGLLLLERDSLGVERVVRRVHTSR